MDEDIDPRRDEPPSPSSPGEFSDDALDDWIAGASSPGEFSDAALDDWIAGAAASSTLPALVKAEVRVRAAEDTKENTQPNISLTVKRQKLDDVSIHFAERPLQRGRHIVPSTVSHPSPPLKTAEDERPDVVGTAVAVGMVDSVEVKNNGVSVEAALPVQDSITLGPRPISHPTVKEIIGQMVDLLFEWGLVRNLHCPRPGIIQNLAKGFKNDEFLTTPIIYGALDWYGTGCDKYGTAMDMLERVNKGYHGHEDKIWGVFALNSLSPEQDLALLVKLKHLLETIRDLPHLPLPYHEHLKMFLEIAFRLGPKPRLLMYFLEVGIQRHHGAPVEAECTDYPNDLYSNNVTLVESAIECLKGGLMPLKEHVSELRKQGQSDKDIRDGIFKVVSSWAPMLKHPESGLTKLAAWKIYGDDVDFKDVFEEWAPGQTLNTAYEDNHTPEQILRARKVYDRRVSPTHKPRLLDLDPQNKFFADTQSRSKDLESKGYEIYGTAGGVSLFRNKHDHREIVMSPTHPRGSLCNSTVLKDGSHLCNVGSIKKASFEAGIESDTILGLVNFLMDYDSPRMSPFIQMTCEFSFWHENLKQYPTNSALAAKLLICKDDAHREKLVKQSDMQITTQDSWESHSASVTNRENVLAFKEQIRSSDIRRNSFRSQNILNVISNATLSSSAAEVANHLVSAGLMEANSVQLGGYFQRDIPKLVIPNSEISNFIGEIRVEFAKTDRTGENSSVTIGAASKNERERFAAFVQRCISEGKLPDCEPFWAKNTPTDDGDASDPGFCGHPVFHLTRSQLENQCRKLGYGPPSTGVGRGCKPQKFSGYVLLKNINPITRK